MSTQRNPKIQAVHLNRMRARIHRPRPIQKESLKILERAAEVETAEDKLLVTQRKALEEVEPIWVLRWLLRKYFAWRGFACRHHCGECDGKCYASIEYRGTFDSEHEAYARWLAMCPGGAIKPIPHNAGLPEETVQYKPGDVPLSEASAEYRKGILLPFVAVPRSEIEERNKIAEKIERLREKIRATDPVMQEFGTKAV